MPFGLIIGAGAIGRGFIADLLDESGWDIGFVNRSKKKIDRLNHEGSYLIKYPGSDRGDKMIKVKKAITISNSSELGILIKKADVIFISVGANNLKDVAKKLEKHLIERLDFGYSGTNIVICENLMNSASEFIEGLDNKYIVNKDEGFSVISSVIFRRVRKTKNVNSLTLLSENYNIIPVEKDGIVNSLDIIGLMPVENIKIYEEKKLFMYNAGHGAAAFIGYTFGKEYMHEAIFDPFIYEVSYGIMEECSIAIRKKYGFFPKEKEIRSIIKKFGNEKFIDPFFQVCREPLRKISRNERFVGGMRLVKSYGGDWSPYAEAIAAVLNYNYKKDDQSRKMQKYIKEKNLEKLLEKYSGIDKEGVIARSILRKFKKYNKITNT